MALRETEVKAETFATQEIGLRGDDSQFFQDLRCKKAQETFEDYALEMVRSYHFLKGHSGVELRVPKTRFLQNSFGFFC